MVLRCNNRYQTFKKWNHAAIVSVPDAIRTFTELFSVLVLGEFKEFEHEDEQKESDWVSGKSYFWLKHSTFNPSISVA